MCLCLKLYHTTSLYERVLGAQLCGINGIQQHTYRATCIRVYVSVDKIVRYQFAEAGGQDLLAKS
jgi:hypothetical protein